MQTTNSLWSRCKHALHAKKQIWLIPAYAFFYILAFTWLEKHVTATGSHFIIHCPLDDVIPFCEHFIVFYYGWFIYMTYAFVHLILAEKEPIHFNTFVFYLGFGMTIFLVISFIFPNGLNLRPETFPRDNSFSRMVAYLYSHDTPTNVMPSIHVHNSLAVYFALRRTSFYRKHKVARALLLLFALMIVLSTMLLKQHSVYDVLMGTGLAVGLYLVLYRPWKKIEEVYI